MFKQASLAVALCGAILAGPCMAHATLQSSSPAAQVAVLKLISGGKEIPIAVDKSAKATPSFTYPLPALAPGSYTVQWSAMAAGDGHVTKGSFAFSIAGQAP